MALDGKTNGATEQFSIKLPFDEEVLRPRFDGLVADNFVVHARQNDDRNRVTAFKIARQGAETLRVGQRQVKQHNVYFLLVDDVGAFKKRFSYEKFVLKRGVFHVKFDQLSVARIILNQ